jgi:hypothetical protein
VESCHRLNPEGKWRASFLTLRLANFDSPNATAPVPIFGIKNTGMIYPDKTNMKCLILKAKQNIYPIKQRADIGRLFVLIAHQLFQQSFFNRR